MKTKTIILISILVLAGAGIWYWQYVIQQTPNPLFIPSDIVGTNYKNSQYGFSIVLPDSWKGYTVLNSQWEGRNVMTDYIVDQGAIITLRHPRWTTTNPREDMPIMIFTLTQWDDVKSGKMSLGAAPIPPSVLGQNSKYVLALPARYNYDFKTGWEEVDQLVHTLKAYEPAVQQGGTGILTGHVTIGPNCPIEREGVVCTPSPEAYQAIEVIVYGSNVSNGDPGILIPSETIAGSTHLDSSGNYSLSLPAGSYFATYKYSGGLPGWKPASFGATVKSGQTTTLNIGIDTGIR
ncbi:MAG: hypothetical protein Q7S43_00320 [bacterium]|nr:hypothetical protein [bacterium]